MTEVEIKLDDLQTAPAIARRLADATGLKVTSWTDKNQRLREALEGQSRSGDIIKAFTLLTIVIGVASALLLTTYRRRPEIGIMRSFGISQRFVLWIFLLQGVAIGLIGAALGSLGGYGFANIIASIERPSGGSLLPVDPAQGQYVLALVLATLASIAASIWPARAASRIDPVEAISQ
ncbi:MAG: ABC transporter permease [Gammaproteobacteria bacterium]|nr:ABC transporter permease [Gammaproteobacteria bacterium]